MSREFDNALNDCLERIARGESASQCIERYPKFARDLLPLLTTAHRTMQVSDGVTYRQHARTRGMNLMLNTLSEGGMNRKRRFSFTMWRPLASPVMVGFVAVFLTLVAAGGTTMASADSIPGEPLYRVKTIKENLTLRVSWSDMDRARVHADLANERGEEIDKLISNSRYAEAEMMVAYLMDHLNASASYAGVLLTTDPIEMPRRPIQIGNRGGTVVVRTTLEQNGNVLHTRLVGYMESAPPVHRLRIQRMLYQSDLGYRIVVRAMAEPMSAETHLFWRVESPMTRLR